LTRVVKTLRDSTSWSQPRSSDKLVEFLTQQGTAIKTTPADPPGAPHTIIVTLSGIRAADVCRSLKSGLTKQGIKDQKIEKLFAKHLKLKDQVAQLKVNK
jgi:protein CMS1